MFINQINTPRFKFYLYLPFFIGFCAVSLFSFFATNDLSTKKIVQEMIELYGKNLTFVQLVFPLSIALFLLIIWVKTFHNQRITTLTTSRKRIDFKRFFFSFGLCSAFIVISLIYQFIFNPNSFTLIFDFVPFIIFLFLASILIPMQAGFEEYFFRAYLMQGIGVATKSRIFALCFTSIFFGFMHFSSESICELGAVAYLYFIGTGFFLGIITLLDDGIELAWGVHTATNLVGYLLITSDWSSLQTNSVFHNSAKLSLVMDILLPIFVIYPIMIYIFGKKYGWRNWQQKLIRKVTKP